MRFDPETAGASKENLRDQAVEDEDQQNQLELRRGRSPTPWES